jgi:hypothetical protein
MAAYFGLSDTDEDTRRAKFVFIDRLHLIVGDARHRSRCHASRLVLEVWNWATGLSRSPAHQRGRQMLQAGMENKYRFDMQVSARPMAAIKPQDSPRALRTKMARAGKDVAGRGPTRTCAVSLSPRGVPGAICIDSGRLYLVLHFLAIDNGIQSIAGKTCSFASFDIS